MSNEETNVAEEKKAEAALNGSPEAKEISEKEADELIEGLQKSETRTPVTSSYFDPEVGESVTCIFLGLTTFTNKDGEEIPAVKLLTEDGSFTKNATKILVEDLSKLGPKTPVEITKIGEEKGPKGTYYKWRISKLS